MAGAAIIIGGLLATAPAKADVDLDVKASGSNTGKPVLIVSPQKWRAGDKVTLTAKGLTPGEKSGFGLGWPKGHQPLAEWQATANSSGVATVTVTWPGKDPASDSLEPGLYDLWTSKVSIKLTMMKDGQWVTGTNPTGPASPTTQAKETVIVSPEAWRAGDRVTVTVKGLVPGSKPVFGLGWVNGHQPLAEWSATANSSGVATVTITWPGKDPANDKLEPGKYVFWASSTSINLTLQANGQWVIGSGNTGGTTGDNGGLPKTGD